MINPKCKSNCRLASPVFCAGVWLVEVWTLQKWGAIAWTLVTKPLHEVSLRRIEGLDIVGDASLALNGLFIIYDDNGKHKEENHGFQELHP